MQLLAKEVLLLDFASSSDGWGAAGGFFDGLLKLTVRITLTLK